MKKRAFLSKKGQYLTTEEKSRKSKK